MESMEKRRENISVLNRPLITPMCVPFSLLPSGVSLVLAGRDGIEARSEVREGRRLFQGDELEPSIHSFLIGLNNLRFANSIRFIRKFKLQL